MHTREILVNVQTLRSPGVASGASSSNALSYPAPFADIVREEEGWGRLERSGKSGAGR